MHGKLSSLIQDHEIRESASELVHQILLAQALGREIALASDLVRMIRGIWSKDFSDLSVLGNVITVEAELSIKGFGSTNSRDKFAAFCLLSNLLRLVRQVRVERQPTGLLVGTVLIELQDWSAIEESGKEVCITVYFRADTHRSPK